MSCNERKKTKSKSPGSIKKTQPRIEAIKVTVERKKNCNDKALQIVTDFSEGTISKDRLLDNLKFINQEHYQDIVEERAINKLCGYPLCPNILKNIPSKQFHISTTLNKVFDITDRKTFSGMRYVTVIMPLWISQGKGKELWWLAIIAMANQDSSLYIKLIAFKTSSGDDNFCSNLCYKASRFLKDQVSTSPLWLREDDSTTFTLISLESRGGISGDEVDLGISPVKLDLDNLLSTPPSTELNDDSHLEDKLETKGSHENCTNVGTNETKCPRSENPLSESLSHCKNSCEHIKEHGSSEETLISSKDQNHEDLMCETSAESNNSGTPTKYHDCPSGDDIRKQESLHISNKTTIEKENSTLDSSKPDGKTQSQDSIATSHKHSSKRKSSSAKNKSNSANTNPIQNVVLKIEQILREWISVDSLCFIFGEEKIKEILAEKKNHNLPAFTQDVHLYERYLAICKKLNILELEDTKIDASYKDEAKKPLPDYEALKEEARQMEIKVKMFFKGDKVHFEDTELGKEGESKSGADVDPVLPLVDVHAQKALRRRIVIDKLRRVLQDLQKSLGLRGFNLTADVRTLAGTLTLSAHNITMKPAEWNLICIAVIKLLSLRDSLLAQALDSSTAHRHLTLLLMSYSLDPGYLDRLMVWLTDVEAVLQKT